MDTTPTISPVLRYEDGPAALEWLARAFGFEKHSDHRTPDGQVAHADLRLGPSAIGVSSAGTSPPDSPWASARQGVYVQVDNPDAVHDRARAAGADIVVPLKDLDYGSRDFSMRDPGGHLWGFGTYRMAMGGAEPTIWPELRYPDAAAAIAWLERALGCACAVRIPGKAGTVTHAELRLGRAALMLGPQTPGTEWSDATQVTSLRVADPDAHFARARSAGAQVVREPQTAPYGARFYAVRDPEGFLWWVTDYAPAG
jgi:uncharacterized glyoxalase superfamily protein PhnB